MIRRRMRSTSALGPEVSTVCAVHGDISTPSTVSRPPASHGHGGQTRVRAGGSPVAVVAIGSGRIHRDQGGKEAFWRTFTHDGPLDAQTWGSMWREAGSWTNIDDRVP